MNCSFHKAQTLSWAATEQDQARPNPLTNTFSEHQCKTAVAPVLCLISSCLDSSWIRSLSFNVIFRGSFDFTQFANHNFFVQPAFISVFIMNTPSRMLFVLNYMFKYWPTMMLWDALKPTSTLTRQRECGLNERLIVVQRPGEAATLHHRNN